jgi:RNase adaptor protein for sRNA GlmZ degradation
VIIAVGCAGGRHRSAVIAEHAARLLNQRGVPAAVTHRDLHRPVAGRAGRQPAAAAAS